MFITGKSSVPFVGHIVTKSSMMLKLGMLVKALSAKEQYRRAATADTVTSQLTPKARRSRVSFYDRRKKEKSSNTFYLQVFL